jgi:biotin transport system substrate-specific component
MTGATDPRFPPVVIRASAGTGKTFQLSNRFLALAFSGAQPDHILATTFTRKAAGEILDRVLVRLAEAAGDERKCRELAAHVRVPVPGTDVPMTLQLLAVLVAGLALPTGESVGSMAFYLVCGAAGLPMFAAGSAGLAGATAGYLVGFVVAVAFVGLLRGRRSGTWRMMLAATVGAATVLASGAAWRAIVFDDWTWAAATGVLPFAPKAMIEVLLAVAIVKRTGGLPARSH